MKIKLSKSPFVYNNGWTVEYNNPVSSFDPSRISLHLEPEQKNGFLEGAILAERMKYKGLNSNALKFLLDNPSLIPNDWKGKFVSFFGTIFRSTGNNRYVLCLYWSEKYGSLLLLNFDLDGEFRSINPSCILTG